MYWCKIATTESEFEQIARLNYETFVEEIPQHSPNDERKLVDRLHHENTYLVVYKDDLLIGMLAFRDARPFSLDEKIGDVEAYLAADFCEKLCEIRLLAVKKKYRNGRVFLQLANALFQYVYTQGYTATVISGTTREERLYKHLGFEQMAPVVGKEDALFIPMVLTRDKCIDLQKTLRIKQQTFYPGPIMQTETLTHTNTSHRSSLFQYMYTDLKSKLLELSKAHYVTTAVGTGTLANDIMFGQLKSDFPSQKGLILINGEFGERLAMQATHWGLTFDRVESAWGEPFELDDISEAIQTQNYSWLAFVHGETSTGMVNDLQAILQIAKNADVKVCTDCISSFGAFSYSLKDYYLATSVSGKSIGALSGLAFVFSSFEPTHTDAPLYSNLANYYTKDVPFTLPSYLVANCSHALNQYPKRYEVLLKRLQQMKASPFAPYIFAENANYPAIITLVFPPVLAQFSTNAKLNGLLLHDESEYLQQRGYTQISMLQPDFEEAFAKLCNLFEQYQHVENSSLV